MYMTFMSAKRRHAACTYRCASLIKKLKIMIKKFVLSILLVFAFLGCQQETESKEIVFVCTHGAARSPIAAAYFNKLAKENDLNFRGIFRGTEPDKILTKETVSGLTNDGFEVSNWKPEKVSIEEIEKAYKVVTFDCSVASEKSSIIEEWNGTPSISKDYDAARDVIKENVEQLIEKLKKE